MGRPGVQLGTREGYYQMQGLRLTLLGTVGQAPTADTPSPLLQALSTCPKCHTCPCWCHQRQAPLPPPSTALPTSPPRPHPSAAATAAPRCPQVRLASGLAGSCLSPDAVQVSSGPLGSGSLSGPGVSRRPHSPS